MTLYCSLQHCMCTANLIEDEKKSNTEISVCGEIETVTNARSFSIRTYKTLHVLLDVLSFYLL